MPTDFRKRRRERGRERDRERKREREKHRCERETSTGHPLAHALTGMNPQPWHEGTTL